MRQKGGAPVLDMEHCQRIGVPYYDAFHCKGAYIPNATTNKVSNYVIEL